MFSQLIGASIRAFLMVLLIVLPSIMLVGTSGDTIQMVILAALVAGIFTFVEYNSISPSLVEFRHAPPFNRLRFCILFLVVFSLSLVAKGKTDPTTITELFSLIGSHIASALDFPYSPVRLVVLMLPAEASPNLIENVRTAAGFSYAISLLGLLSFIASLWLSNWPNQQGGAFNVWLNLPTFDPTTGGDVLSRLERDSYVNLILGFLLPFLIPAFVKLSSDYLNPVSLDSAHTLIWMMTAWAFLPVSLMMRGVALVRVAQMIAAQRERAYLSTEDRETVAI